MISLDEWNGGAVVISSLGVVLCLLYSWYITSRQYFLEGPSWLFPLGLLFVLVLSAGLVYGGYWLAGSELDADFVVRVAIWCFTGLVGALSLTFWPIFYQLTVGVNIEDPLFILLVSAGIGANAGLLIGMYDMRSRHQVARVERTRDSLEFLNRLLGHNVYNAATVVRDYATTLESGHRDEVTANASVIRAKSDQITDLVDNADALLARVDGETVPEPVDLSRIVERELDTARKTYDAEIDAEIEPDVSVHGDEILSVVVDNLVDNAVEHSDRILPTVTVSLETDDDVARLAIADDGPGIREKYKAVALERDEQGALGLGLYLVSELVADYGGRVDIADNEPRGTVVTVELPLAE